MSLILDGTNGLSDVDGSAATPAIRGSDANTGIFFPAADTIAFAEGGVEAARFDSSGNLGLGVTPSAFEVFTALQVKNAAVLGLNAGQSHFTHNSYFQEPGGVATWKYIGSGNALRYSMISGQHTWSIAPSGTAGNAISFTEAMRIDSAGNVGIGTSSPASNSKLHVLSSGTAFSTTVGTTAVFQRSGASFNGCNVAIIGGNGGGSTLHFGDTDAQDIGAINYSHETNHMAFNTNGTERARIDSSGNLLVGTTSQINAGLLNLAFNTGANCGIATRPTNNAGYDAARFFNSSTTQIGSISCTTTATSYVTSSDYRLKEDWQPMQGAITRLNQLKPVNFAWKVDGSRVDGFLAHEAQEVVPECVTGTKDAVDAEGKPEYQGIDQSKLVPLLTAA